MKKFIIWIFEKYYVEDWLVSLQEKMDKELMVKNDIKTKEELQEYCSDLHNQPLREAYQAGRIDMYNQIIANNAK